MISEKDLRLSDGSKAEPGNELRVVEIQSRWKSKYMWAALISQIVAILEFAGFWKSIGVDFGWVNTLVAMVLQLLVTIGILNSSTDANNW